MVLVLVETERLSCLLDMAEKLQPPKQTTADSFYTSSIVPHGHSTRGEWYIIATRPKLIAQPAKRGADRKRTQRPTKLGGAHKGSSSRSGSTRSQQLHPIGSSQVVHTQVCSWHTHNPFTSRVWSRFNGAGHSTPRRGSRSTLTNKRAALWPTAVSLSLYNINNARPLLHDDTNNDTNNTTKPSNLPET